MKMYEIIWPEHRYVTENQIKSWYNDGVANCEVEDTELNDPEEMARELHSVDLITLGRGRR